MKLHTDKRKIRFWGILNGILLLPAALCIGIMIWMSGRLTSLSAAEVWRGSSEMHFAQIACFLPVTEGKTEDDILQFRQTLERQLTQAALTAPEGGRLWQDAWSAPGKVSVSAAHGKTEAAAIGVGGNFFLFHPLQLRSGSYLQESDLMHDRVVLDEELAWALFGSPDVTGMELEIAGTPFRVAGVVRREEDFASRAAYRDGPGLFLSYSALNRISPQGITCYELVLPDPIAGFGVTLVRESFPVGTGAVVENSVRFRLKNLMQVAGDYGHRSMGLSGVAYPYWENAVRMTEDDLSALLVLTAVLCLVPAVTLLGAVLAVAIKAVRCGRQRIPAAVDALVERHREARCAARQNTPHKPLH